MKHDYATVNGVRLHYVTAGEGPLMLFVHGYPEAWFAWEKQLAEFSRDHQVVAMDTRGINLSEKPAEVAAYSARHQVEDLRQLVGHFGRTSAIVVAHDWGGAAAWNLAAWHPEVVSKLVILNSPHPIMFTRELARNPEQQAASKYMLLFRDPKAERVMSENNYERMFRQLNGWIGGPNAPDAATLEQYRQAWAQPGAMTAGFNYYRASPLHPDPQVTLGQLSKERFTVKVPTLVIWGERDTALKTGLLDGLDEFVPDLRIERIPEATHWVFHEFPERVNRLIRDFIGN